MTATPAMKINRSSTDKQLDAMLADPAKYFTRARAAAKVEARKVVARRAKLRRR